MPRTLQSASRKHLPESKPVKLGKPFLTLGAVAGVAATLAIKAALPSFYSEPQVTLPLNLTAESISDPMVSEAGLPASAPFPMPEPEPEPEPIKVTAAIDVKAAADPIHIAKVVAAIRLPIGSKPTAQSEAAEAHPEASEASRAAGEKASAKFSLNQKLAKLKLKRALLAAQAARTKDVIEISPAEGAVVADAGSSPAPAADPADEPVSLAETYAPLRPVPAATATASLSAPRQPAPVVTADRYLQRLPMIDEVLPPIDAEGPVQTASIAPNAAQAESSLPAAASKRALRTQPELPASSAARSSSEKMTIASVLYGSRNASRLPMIDEELPPIDADVPVQVASLTPSNVLPAPSQRPRPLVRSNPAAESKPGAINKPRKPVKAKTKTKTKDKPRHTKPAPVLAYAAPQEPKTARPPFDGIGKLFNSGKAGLPGRSSKIAVYDISAAVVHMPDGSKLKANSGIGHRMNKPKYAYVKNLGPTPPNVYKLRMRERRFHGVEAIRMLPYDVAAMRGRDGMLAHSPLLRKSKGSHGCVAFTRYNKFLRAFKKGKVKTMIVVPNMSQLPKYMALYKERHYASR